MLGLIFLTVQFFVALAVIGAITFKMISQIQEPYGAQKRIISFGHVNNDDLAESRTVNIKKAA